MSPPGRPKAELARGGFARAAEGALTSTPPSIEIRQVRFLTDRPLGNRRARALGEVFARELALAVAAVSRAPVRLSFGELLIEAGGRELDDPRASARLAAAVAQRILERARE
jgi:hypothetical protein